MKNNLYPLLTLMFLILAIIAIFCLNFGAGAAAFVGYLITGAAWMYHEIMVAPEQPVSYGNKNAPEMKD